MNFFLKFTFLVFCLSVFFSCSKQNNKAQARVEDSFSSVKIHSASGLQLDHEYIQIEVSALEKEFLLQVSMISQTTAATGKALKSRIVAFHRKGNKVYLLEANAGHTITLDFPQNLVLAELPIVSETKKALVIDFNKGMSQLMVSSEWRAHDYVLDQYNSSEIFSTVPLRYSYIESAVVEDNNLVIRQIAQAVYQAASKDEKIVPVEIKYYLSPYQPNPHFQSFQGLKDYDWVGYFETAALQRLNQEAVTFATKFNKQNSIVYAISNNTPEIFIEAIRDGALYWNQAFGYEAIKVIKAPKNITAPSFKYNLIQWVANDYAGSAYADAQVDPRTGETLHAQIFLTSAFAITGKKAARKAILKWDYWQKNNHQKEKEKEVKNLTLKGFDRFELCNFSLNENFIDHLRELVFNQADDAKILKAVSDFIRQVTAHEVGHTLGLRHNFAGSLAANYNALERFDLTKSYNETGSIPKNIIPASSVMDYFIFDEASWIGDIIAKKSGSLSYDALAIQVLYFGKSLDEGNKPLFCTDSHVDKIADCNRFDVGNSYFEIIKMNEDFFARRVAYKILDKFINAKAPPEGELKKSLAKVLMPDPQEFMKMLYPKSFGVMNSLRPAFRLLSIERAQPVIDMTNKVYVQEQAWNYLQNEIVAYGGLDYFLKDEGIASIDKAKEIFKNILEEQKKGLGPAGQEYEFSDQEKQLILDRTDKFFKVLLKDGPLFYANLLNGQLITSETVKENLGILPKHGFSDEVATSLLAQAKKIIFEQTIDKMEVEIDVPLTPVPPVPVVPGVPGAPPTPAVVPLLTKKITVTLPIYKYNYEMRLIAANFLSAKRSESMIWGFLERKGLLAEFKKTNKEILTVDLALIKADEATSVKAAKWIKENQSILQAIIKSSER